MVTSIMISVNVTAQVTLAEIYIYLYIYIYTLPTRIDVTSRQLIFWEFSTYSYVYQKYPKPPTTTLIPGTTFIKIKESSTSASHKSVIPATASLKIREHFRFSHKSVKTKLFNVWLCAWKNKSFECWIVINSFENIYGQAYIRLIHVLLIRFNSIEQKTWFLYTSSRNICTMNFCPIQRRCRNLLLCFRLEAKISNILIFSRHFFHQTHNKQSLTFNVVSVF